ncbi:MAG TPA: hypothetical protein VFZ65_19990 [Planctomycetota bacterium]|nr:hypothetical protein [Planctomycetota bacterium]
MAVPEVNLGFHPSAQPVDADGRIVLKRCAPRAHHLRVVTETEKLREHDLLIEPGLNPEVVVRLPVAVKAR